MKQQPTVWGLHMGGHVGDRPIEGNYVAIGWRALGDLRAIPADREAFKSALRQHLPDLKEGAVPVNAGTLFRFVHEMSAGDVVVYPSKHDRMINIGRFTGDASYLADDPDEYPNRRTVEWLGHFPRTEFSQSALRVVVEPYGDEIAHRRTVSRNVGQAPSPRCWQGLPRSKQCIVAMVLAVRTTASPPTAVLRALVRRVI